MTHYTLIRDFGINEEHLRLEDVVLSSVGYELFEGGTVKLKFTIQYNGDELQDNEIFGELSSLASDGEIFIKLLKPAEMKVAKKGYRAGKPDTQTTPEKDPNQRELDDGQQSPEEAFAQAAMDQVWVQYEDDLKFDSVEALLQNCMESDPLEVGQELTLESESGKTTVIRITSVDEEAGTAEYQVVPIREPESTE